MKMVWVHLLLLAPFLGLAVVPGKTQRPGHAPTNNEMVKHKNKWWEIKTIKTRNQLSESGQDFRHSTAPPEYEKMPYGQGCPPGRDFEEDDCRRLKKVPALKFVDVGNWRGYLPKCFLIGRKRVYYNRGGKVPPYTNTKHQAMCKKERLPPGSGCKAIHPTGPHARAECVFPFKYRGVLHSACTLSGDHKQPWCSTKTDDNYEHKSGTWATCALTCPTEVSKIKLVGGKNEWEGNIMVGGKPVCDDGAKNYGDAVAHVVCRELGHDGRNFTVNSHFGQVSDDFAMDEVKCKGTEEKLLDCSHETKEDCSGNEGLGVICTPKIKKGVVTSPNYPEKYPNNLNKWTKRIEVEEGLVLSLKFTAFDVEDGANWSGGSKCSFDYLEIFDEKKNQLMKSCGSSLPDPITTKTNIVDLVFVTDGSEQKTGWKITWTAMKQGASEGEFVGTGLGKDRLPGHLTPENYTINLVPFLIHDNFTIRGDVEIIMLCNKPSDNVTLHVNDMLIERSNVELKESDSGTKIPITGHKYEKDTHFYISKLGKKLVPGKRYTIKISYTAHLRENRKGFYLSRYKDKETGRESYMASTQFQIGEARRAFPCFDEPAMRAVFHVSLGRPKSMSSISNMPIKKKGEVMDGTDEYVWDRYEESIKMSTYLVAFVVTKFEFLEEEHSWGKKPVDYRFWAEPSSLDQVEYAQDISPKTLEFFEEYFEVPYTLSKMDMISPPDYTYMGMENWGLCTYRDVAFYYKEGVTDVKKKQWIAMVIAHEIAHQWFGNLVTPSWWNDLWLSEGFAMFVPYLSMEKVQPEFKFLDQFVIDVQQSVFAVDELESSHPIVNDETELGKILSYFDDISYNKGASIIRMMEKFITAKTFRRGLTNYLNELQYKSATQNDLWRHMTKQAHKDRTLKWNMDPDVKTVMDTWTLQDGFPVITVKRNYKKKTAEATQRRFLISHQICVLCPSPKVCQIAYSLQCHDSSGPRWWVPITFAPAGGNFNDTKTKTWLSKDEESVTVSGLPNSRTAVVFNVQETGYYRVNYDEKNWRLINRQLHKPKGHLEIHVANRAQIMDDAINLAKSGHLDYETALGLLSYLSQEKEYVPWFSALKGLSYINNRLKGNDAHGLFKKYMLRLLGPIYRELGFLARPEDTHHDILLRKKVVSWACNMGSQDCLEKAMESFSNWMRTPDPDHQNPVNVNLREEIYCIAIAKGEKKEWDFARKRLTASSLTEKTNLLSSLGCTKNVKLLERSMELSIEEGSGIRKVESFYVMENVARNPLGSDLALKFIRDKWESFFSSESGSSFGAPSFPSVIKTVANSYKTQREINQLKEFETALKELGAAAASAAATVTKAITAAQFNVWWTKTYKDQIFDWLKKKDRQPRLG